MAAKERSFLFSKKQAETLKLFFYFTKKPENFQPSAHEEKVLV
jgi:hypothetical protein